MLEQGVGFALEHPARASCLHVDPAIIVTVDRNPPQAQRKVLAEFGLVDLAPLATARAVRAIALDGLVPVVAHLCEEVALAFKHIKLLCHF
jgi:hypothetical protein